MMSSFYFNRHIGKPADGLISQLDCYVTKPADVFPHKRKTLPKQSHLLFLSRGTQRSDEFRAGR